MAREEMRAADVAAAGWEREVRLKAEAEAQEAEAKAREESDRAERARQAELERERQEAEERRRADAEAAERDRTAQQGKADEVVQALNELRSRHRVPEELEGLHTCLKTVRAYVSNLAKNPQEAKFQKINRTNNAFSTRVEPFPEAIAVLMAVGFVEEGDQLVVPPAYIKSKGPRLWDALAKIDVVLDRVAQAAERAKTS